LAVNAANGVAWKDYPFKREYPERGITSSEYENAEEKWLQLTLDDEEVKNSDWSVGVME
jgi:hypothetical protein